ncbi:MAG: CopK family periplasmic copper-binding protein [Burkholderiaceae bacterium]
MHKQFAALAIGTLLACSAMAQGVDPKDYDRKIDLKNGETVYIFKDGRMAYEDSYGRPVRVKKGEVLETRQGEKLTVRSDDEGRLLQLQPKN